MAEQRAAHQILGGVQNHPGLGGGGISHQTPQRMIQPPSPRQLKYLLCDKCLSPFDNYHI